MAKLEQNELSKLKRLESYNTLLHDLYYECQDKRLVNSPLPVISEKQIQQLESDYNFLQIAFDDYLPDGKISNLLSVCRNANLQIALLADSPSKIEYRTFENALWAAGAALGELLDRMCRKSNGQKMKDDAEIIINGGNRFITIDGLKPFFVRGENQWDFIKNLVGASKSDEYIPHEKESKLSYDGLRNALKKAYNNDGKTILKRLIVSNKKAGYRLGSVKLTNFSNVGLRRTHMKAEQIEGAGDLTNIPER